MALVGSDLVASLNSFEIDDHGRAIGILLEHLYLWLFIDNINRRVFLVDKMIINEGPS